MYNINPANIKAILARMPEKELRIHMRYIQRLGAQCAPGSNRRAMFIRLYQYCLVLLQKQKEDMEKRHYL